MGRKQAMSCYQLENVISKSLLVAIKTMNLLCGAVLHSHSIILNHIYIKLKKQCQAQGDTLTEILRLTCFKVY